MLLPYIDFPDWIYNAIVIGMNEDGEQVAIGMNKGAYLDSAYVWRLAKKNNCWVTVRPATPNDLKVYDQIYLKRLGVKVLD